MTFQTDNEGKINLGPLTNISRVSTSLNGPNGYSQNDYKIESNKEIVSLPESLNILEEEQIELPFACNSEFSEKTCSLVRYAQSTIGNSSNKVLSNYFTSINYSKQEGYQSGTISISGLERGYYLL